MLTACCCPAHPPAGQVIRANETMYKAGQMERVILRKLSEADAEGKRHCIRMLGSFEYRNHLCLVFEAMVRGAQCGEGRGCAGSMWGLHCLPACLPLLLVGSRKTTAI